MTSEQAGSRGDAFPTQHGRRNAMRQQLFGDHFPDDLNDGPQWRTWVDKVLQEQNAIMQDKRLYWSRNRHFRQDRQWISSRNARTWRELDAGSNTMRQTMNLIAPALDFRLGIITEQRPGFRTHPLGTGVAARETAEAQQAVAEHYYNKLGGLKLTRDAASDAQTDGVAFTHVYVDKNSGPVHVEPPLVISGDDDRAVALVEAGYELDEEGNFNIPVDLDGNMIPADETPEPIRLGEIGTRVLRAHEVAFDAEARTVNGPYDRAKWCIVKRVRDLKAARRETGNPNLQADTARSEYDPVLDSADVGGPGYMYGFQRGLPPYPVTRQRREEGAFEYLIYIAPNEKAGFDKGIWRRVIGQDVVSEGDDLPGGKIPLARFTDGSSDSEMFPRPIMNEWVNDQMTINALVSLLVSHVRIFGTGRMMALEGTVIQETYSQIVGSLLTYRGQKPDFVQGNRVATSSWNLLEFFITKFEDKSGWTALARGQVTGQAGGGMQDISGRSVLAAKEMFERQFGPMIRATAEGMSELSVLWVDYARWLYDLPRLIPITGRADLAKRIEAEDLGEESVTYVDPQTMTPLPQALRNQMLFDMYQQNLIDAEEYRKRSPFSDIRNVTMGGTDQWERAQNINIFIEENGDQLAQLMMQNPDAPYTPEVGGVIVWWQDDPDAHKRALMELILDDRKTQAVRDVAAARWGLYDQLLRAQVPDPTTGQVGAYAPPVVRGVPADMMPPPPEQQATGVGQVPGAGGPTTSPTPEMSGAGIPAAAQDIAQPLGSLGAAEADQF
jgi:hypothetical protein